MRIVSLVLAFFVVFMAFAPLSASASTTTENNTTPAIIENDGLFPLTQGQLQHLVSEDVQLSTALCVALVFAVLGFLAWLGIHTLKVIADIMLNILVIMIQGIIPLTKMLLEFLLVAIRIFLEALSFVLFLAIYWILPWLRKMFKKAGRFLKSLYIKIRAHCHRKNGNQS